MGFDQPALVQRKRRLPGHRFDHSDAPPLALGLGVARARHRHPPESAARQDERRRDDRRGPMLRRTRESLPGSRTIVAARIRPFRSNRDGARTDAAPRASQGNRILPSAAALVPIVRARREQVILDDTPSTGRTARPLSSISQTAHVWLSLSSTISCVSAPKNPSMSGSRTSRSSASLTTSVCMSARHSRATPLRRLTDQRRAQDVRIVRRRFPPADAGLVRIRHLSRCHPSLELSGSFLSG